jgi:signal transduction histidine kinase
MNKSGSIKKTQFINLSLLFGGISLGIVIYELFSIVYSESVPFTAPWLISLLFLQVSSFYLFLLGFIYANEEGDEFSVRLALFSLGILLKLNFKGLNIIAFALRLVENLVYDGFLPLNLHDVV